MYRVGSKVYHFNYEAIPDNPELDTLKSVLKILVTAGEATVTGWTESRSHNNLGARKFYELEDLSHATFLDRDLFSCKKDTIKQLLTLVDTEIEKFEALKLEVKEAIDNA